MSPKSSAGYLAVIFLFGLPFLSCTAMEENSLTSQSSWITDPDYAYQIAYDAYLFLYPLVEHLRCHSLSMSHPNYAEHTGYDTFYHNNKALPPNDYVVYSTAWVDLSQEARVLTVPMIKDRYYSVQIVDPYTHNVGIISERTTYLSRRGGRYIIAGPGQCSNPPSCYRPYDNLYCAEGDYVLLILRIQYKDEEDIKYKVKSLQGQFDIERLSTYCHIDGPYPVPRPAPIYVYYNDYDQLRFFEYANAALSHVTAHRSEIIYFQEWAKIGILPGGGAYPPKDLPLDVVKKIEQAIWKAIEDIKEQVVHPTNGTYGEGWYSVIDYPWYGPRDVLQGRYLDRAAGVKAGIYGLDKEEAYYVVSRLSTAGHPLSCLYGPRSYYIILAKDQIPPVYGHGPTSYKSYSETPTGFWSITLYDSWTGDYVKDAVRHSIGSRDLDSLCRYKDGSYLIVITTDEPKEQAFKQNWLPAPYGEFHLVLRLYNPLEIAYKLPYLPPGVYEGLPPYPPTVCPYDKNAYNPYPYGHH